MKSDGPNHMDPRRNEVDTVGSGKSTTKKDNLPAIWPNSSYQETKNQSLWGMSVGIRLTKSIQPLVWYNTLRSLASSWDR